MLHKIKNIEPGSIAEQLGIVPGDELVSLNGEDVIDFIDYQTLCYEEKMNLVIRRAGEEMEYEFEKDDYEPLGIEFEGDMLGPTRTCVNHCRFCFVDQLPQCVRTSLKLKDDDWRLSLMMGNYVTLTNVSDRELERIIKRHASPLYISVHATDHEVHRDLVRPAVEFDIMEKLKKLKEGGIEFHTQAVVCPGINDGEVLRKTIENLASLYPACLSLAVVPVGLTGHRGGLDDIKPFDRDSARKLIEMTDSYRKKFMREYDTHFVYPSDELYLTAGLPMPSDSEYEDYAQIDNGVGLCRLLETEYDNAYYDLPEKYKKGGRKGAKLIIACGVSAKPVLDGILNDRPVTGVEVRVMPVENRFFGPSVTVTGLVTGSDLVHTLKNENCDAVLISEVMLRSEGDLFLDDMSLCEVSRLTNKKFIVVGRGGEDLLSAIKAFSNVGKDGKSKK